MDVFGCGDLFPSGHGLQHVPYRLWVKRKSCNGSGTDRCRTVMSCFEQEIPAGYSRMIVGLT